MTPQDILGADEAVCGAMTSGGTESIIMALKAYRDAARAQRPDLAVPEMYAFFFFAKFPFGSRAHCRPNPRGTKELLILTALPKRKVRETSSFIRNAQKSLYITTRKAA
jgi:hypothetical protein